MKFLLTILLTIALSARGEDQCTKVVPQSDVDWTKLTGSWNHLMFFSGGDSFRTCRKMKIFDVNPEEKIANVEFNDLITVTPKLIRHDFVYFRWTENQGIIHTGIKAGYKSQKFSSKFASKRKSVAKSLSGLKVAVYTVIATDYSEYIILVQCRTEAVPSVWISLKSTTMQSDLASTIRERLDSVGLNATAMNFNTTQACHP